MRINAPIWKTQFMAMRGCIVSMPLCVWEGNAERRKFRFLCMNIHMCICTYIRMYVHAQRCLYYLLLIGSILLAIFMLVRRFRLSQCSQQGVNALKLSASACAAYQWWKLFFEKQNKTKKAV